MNLMAKIGLRPCFITETADNALTGLSLTVALFHWPYCVPGSDAAGLPDGEDKRMRA